MVTVNLDNGPQGDVVEDYDAIGVINALERVCELESRLRASIQSTHPLTTTLDWDFNAADRERDALLAISQQLEYLEDRLREYRFLTGSNSDQKAVVLSQLDAVRRELLDVASRHTPRITFAKEVVREVVAFASAGEDTPRGGASSPAQPSLSKESSRERFPANNNGEITSAASSFLGLMSPRRYGNTNASRSSGSLYTKDPMAAPVPGPQTTGGATRPSRSTAGPSSITSSAILKIRDEDIYGPSRPSSSPGPKASGVSSSNGTGTTSNGDRYGGTIRVREMLARAEQGLSKVVEAQEQRRVVVPPRITSDGTPDRNTAARRGGGINQTGTEDWDGMHDANPSYGAPITLPGTDSHGGFITPRDGVEEEASTWDVNRHMPVSTNNAFSAADWTIKAEGHTRTPVNYHTPGDSAYSEVDRRSGGVGGMVGKLAGLAFVLGSIAAATMAATGTLPHIPSVISGNTGPTTNSNSRNASNNARSKSGNTSNAKKKSPPARGVKGQLADLPPWKEESSSPSRSGAMNKSAPYTGTRKKSTSSSSPGRSSRSSSAASASSIGPVMHVHEPPASRSFPSNPPDVTAAMG